MLFRSDRFSARKKAIEDLTASGLIEKIENYSNNVGHSERTNAAIEPRLSLQWYLKMKEISGPAFDAVVNGEINLIPSKFINTYKYWMENVRDWCLSRQLWWGHRIPAWYDNEGNFVVAADEKTAIEKYKKIYQREINSLRQDDDVLDTWASSWLWPISVFNGFENPKGEIKMMSAVLDSAVFPGTQGGPLEHVIAANAVAFGEALTNEFDAYCNQVIANAQALASAMTKRGYSIISGGTDNHMMLIDLRSKSDEMTGKLAENTLEKCDITINKNTVPFETRSPFVTSGIRLGTSAITTRGFKEKDMETLAQWIDLALSNHQNNNILEEIKMQVNVFMKDYPLYV